MKTRISGKEAARVAEDMAKPGPIRVVAASEAQEVPGALVPSPVVRAGPKGASACPKALWIQTFERYRRGTKQTVEVRHVHTHSGGQGVVGI
jgi:hypothetical protein